MTEQIVVQDSRLPATIDDLSKFVLVGREKLNAVRAEIRAIEKIGLAKEVHEQKLKEAQAISEAVLDAEVKIGELMQAVPKAAGRPEKIIDTVVENKKPKSNEHAAPQYASHPSYQTIIKLGNDAGLPVIACRYADDFKWWRVTPLNKIAKQFVPKQTEMDEKGWVSLLYKIRGYEVPQSILDGMDIEV